VKALTYRDTPETMLELQRAAAASGLPLTVFMRAILRAYLRDPSKLQLLAQPNTQATANPIQQTPVPRVQKPARDLAEELDSLFDS
jgi:hypothetical protein